MRPRRWLLALGSVVCARISVAFWSSIARLTLWAHGARVGRGLRVRGALRLHCHRTGSIRIGDDCRIQSGFAGNAVGGDGRMAIWVGPSGRLTIGRSVGLSSSTIVCMNTVTIEDGALVGGGARIYDTDFHSLDPLERTSAGNPGVRTAPVVIGRRAFVGGHTILLKGVHVGADSVVGAGSVIRGNVPAREVWAGNPGRRIRSLGPAGTEWIREARR
jgi:acetyltransferase-like isoleucine patch superfamily enzyme